LISINSQSIAIDARVAIMNTASMKRSKKFRIDQRFKSCIPI